MARVTDNGLSGVIGNYIFYTRDGNNYVRSKPGKRSKRKGRPENKENNRFARISTFGSEMLRVMKDHLPFSLRLADHNRFRGWMNNAFIAAQNETEWDISAERVMCQLNGAVDLRDILVPAVTVSDNAVTGIRVSIPAIKPGRDLAAPPLTEKWRLKLIATGADFNAPHAGQNVQCIWESSFGYGHELVPAQEISLTLPAKPGDTVIVVLSIAFEGHHPDKLQEQPQWLPAAVIAIGTKK
jgi:hypothetical protein